MSCRRTTSAAFATAFALVACNDGPTDLEGAEPWTFLAPEFAGEVEPGLRP